MANPRYPDPAMVLMLTAAGAPGDRVAGLSLGADDYLAKPFHFPELVLRIRNPARRKPIAHARIFRTGDVELDPVRRTVTRDGHQRDLSAREFAVMEALIERVWDEHADPFNKTVQVTVARLRRKLGEPDIIETIRGVGYRITSH